MRLHGKYGYFCIVDIGTPGFNVKKSLFQMFSLCALMYNVTTNQQPGLFRRKHYKLYYCIRHSASLGIVKVYAFSSSN